MPTDKFIEISDNETLSTIVEKINANFSQVRSLGGGPQGPQGKQGIPGLPGLQGPQGIKGDTGEAGTKIVPLESRPDDQYMELGCLYMYPDDNKNLIASYLEDNGEDELERIETNILPKDLVTSDGWLDQINEGDQSTIMTRLLSRTSSEGGREAGLKIGRGLEKSSENMSTSAISCIDGDEDCSPENSSKLLLLSNKTFNAKLPIRGVDKQQVQVAPQLLIGTNYTSSVIGTFEYGEDDDKGVAILGYDDRKSNLFVNGEVMSEKGFTTNFSGEAKTFGGKGEDGEFNFGNVNVNNTLKSGLNVKGRDVTLLSDHDIELHSKNALKVNVDMLETPADSTIAAITIDTKGREGVLLDYKAAEGEGSALRITDNGSNGLTITNANKPFVINGLNGDVEMQFMKKQGAESPGSFHMSFGKNGDIEDGGIFADYDRISYYGKDGMQIKLSNINTTLEREYSNNASDKHIYSNLIEFCYEKQSSSSGKDYVFGPSELNIINKCKIGEIIATAETNSVGNIENVNMNIISNNSLNIESLKNNVNVQAAEKVSIKDNKHRIIFFNENNYNDRYYFYLDYLKTEMFDLYIDKVYKYIRTDNDNNHHISKDITNEFSGKLNKIIGKIIFSGKQAYIKIDLSLLNETKIIWDEPPYYQSIYITFKIKYRTNQTTYSRKLKTGLGNDDFGINNEYGVGLNFLNVGGNYTPHLQASTDTKTHVWFFRSANDDGSYYECEGIQIYEPLLCIECEYIDSTHAKLLTASSYINAHIATDVNKNKS